MFGIFILEYINKHAVVMFLTSHPACSN